MLESQIRLLEPCGKNRWCCRNKRLTGPKASLEAATERGSVMKALQLHVAHLLRSSIVRKRRLGARIYLHPQIKKGKAPAYLDPFRKVIPVSVRTEQCGNTKVWWKDKGKTSLKTDHEGLEEEQRYSFTLSLNSVLDWGGGGSTVVKVLYYKSEGRWFDPSWCHWNFSLR